MLVWQGRACVSPPLLLQGQVTGYLPVELGRVRVVQDTVVGPRYRAEHVAVVTVQVCDVLGRESAAVGDEQRPRSQDVLGQQPIGVLADGGVTVAIAVQGLAQNGDGPKFIDHAGDADLNEFGVVTMAMCDVRGRNVGRVRWWPGVVGWAWL